MSPAMVFAPVGEGGLGLQSIRLVIKAQAARRAAQWMVDRESVYKASWRIVAADGVDAAHFSTRIEPTKPNKQARKRLQDASIYGVGLECLKEQMLNQTPVTPAWIAQAQDAVRAALHTTMINWSSGNEPTVTIDTNHPHSSTPQTTEIQNFWPTFKWADNQWIVRADDQPLAAQAFAFMQNCSLQQLQIVRDTATTYRFKPVLVAKHWTSRRLDKLRELITAILVCSPPIKVGCRLAVGNEVQLRHSPALKQQYSWICNGRGGTIGMVSNQTHSDRFIDLYQRTGEWLWDVTGNSADTDTQEDADALRAVSRKHGIAFVAHPACTTYPWHIQETSSSRRGFAAIDKAYKRQLRRSLIPTATALTDKLQRAAERHQWDKAVQGQSVWQVWQTRQSVTSYQAWTWYRISTQQLNLYHDRHREPCLLHDRCNGAQSVAHIMWECPRSTAAWQWFALWWTGEALTTMEVDKWKAHALHNIATRHAIATSQRFVTEVNEQFGAFSDEHAEAMTRIWFVVATVIPTTLWCLRNATVFNDKAMTAAEAASAVEQVCTSQLMAISTALASQLETRVEGICLRQFVNAMNQLQRVKVQPEALEACIHFDGGARGNPGPGGSGWVLALKTRAETQWSIEACGYKYHGDQATNNEFEYMALLEGVAYAVTCCRNIRTSLTMIGDSRMIINQMTGRARIKAAHLQYPVQRIQTLTRHFAAVTWAHTQRAQNKAADFMANVAIDSKARATLTREDVGIAATRFERTKTLLRADTCERQESVVSRTLRDIIHGKS